MVGSSFHITDLRGTVIDVILGRVMIIVNTRWLLPLMFFVVVVVMLVVLEPCLEIFEILLIELFSQVWLIVQVLVACFAVQVVVVVVGSKVVG